MSRITVVGASGYLGGRIALQLQQEGNEVIGTFRNPPCDPEKKLGTLFDIIPGNITDERFIERIASTKPRVLVYLVSLNHHAVETNYQQSVNVNIAPLMKLARMLADQSGFHRLIYMSTLQVYGSLSPDKILRESDRIEPTNMYGWTHAACEDGLRLLQNTHHLNSISLRLSNGYGAPAFPSCDCWWLVLNDFCRSAIQNERIQLKSNGSPQRDFIHVSDIAGIISEIIKNESEVPQIMNLASGETLSMLELAHLVSYVFKLDFDRYIPVIYPDGTISKVAGAPDQRLQVSTEALFEIIPSLRLYPLIDGIREVIQYILNSNLHKT